MRLRFLQKPDKESTSLRDGTVDLETGVLDDMTGPEVQSPRLPRVRALAIVLGPAVQWELRRTSTPRARPLLSA